MMIVPVTEENIAQAGYVHSESWKASHRDFCTPAFVEAHTPQAQTDYLRREMEAGKRLYLLEQDVPVGIVSLRENVIADLYVHPDFQHQGYGTQLLRFAVSQCRGTPTLWVLNTNTAARSLYARQGFTETGNRKPLKQGMAEIEMCL